MKKYFFLLPLVLSALFACGKKSNHTTGDIKTDTLATQQALTDSLVFEVDTFHVIEKEQKCNDGSCASVNIYYERIKTCLKPVHDSVNQFVDTLILDILDEIGSPEAGRDLKKRALGFIGMSNDPEFGDTGPWDWETRLSIFRPVNEIISVNASWGGYTGGAHGNYTAITVNFFTNTGKRVTLNDIFKDLEALNKIGLKYLKKDNQLDENTDLIDQGWDMGDENFALNDNFDISSEGITWQFNSYEIGPYSAGAPSVTIPMKELAGIMKVKFTDVVIK